jgi:hypothetical protein
MFYDLEKGFDMPAAANTYGIVHAGKGTLSEVC